MNEFEPIRELRRALDALINEAEVYRENLSQSGIDPDYWIAYESDLEEKFEALKASRENLEQAHSSPEQ